MPSLIVSGRSLLVAVTRHPDIAQAGIFEARNFEALSQPIT